MIDPITGASHTLGNYTVKILTVPAGSSLVLQTEGIKLLLPETNETITATFGQVMTPPMKGDPPATGLTPLAYYYFTLSDPDNVSWPIRVYVESPIGSSVVAAYYDKTVGGYEVIPTSLMRFYPDNNTIEILMTRELYDKGDPAIILYASPTVGGILTGETTAQSLGTATILHALILVVVSLTMIARIIIRKYYSYSYI